MDDEDQMAQLIHNYRHAADFWVPWQRGLRAGRAALRRLQRAARNQRDRESRILGYADLGGEA